MISDLAATITLYDRYLAGVQDMLRLTCLSKGKYRGVLQQPDFGDGVWLSLVCKPAHGLPGIRIVLQAH